MERVFLKVYIIGIGVGNNEFFTYAAKKAIKSSDVIIGSRRVTENIDESKEIFNSYKPLEIYEYIKTKSFKNAAVLLSGDVGFYSGAKCLVNLLEEYEIELIPGISSAVFFCARLKMPWEDIKLLSAHGKKANIIGYIRKYKRVFALLSGKDDIKNLCAKLCFYNMGYVILNIGQRLSYSDEKIITAKAEDIKNFDFDDLSVILAENPNAYDVFSDYIDDEEFIRDNVPMTKSEVRTLSVAKLELSPDSVLYDIGAGPGSVSVSAALKIIDGEVYAIEKNENAVKLIEKNKRKFAADNIIVVKGNAPAAFENLPRPTHIFIGGSSGNIREIIEEAVKKNSGVKIVINAVSLNTVAEIINVLREKDFKYEIVCVNVSKNKSISGHELMAGQNPIYIFRAVLRTAYLN